MNIAIPVFTVFGALGLLLGIGTSTSVSICRGQGDELEARRIFTLRTFLTVLTGVLISVLSVAFLRPYARLLGASGELLRPTMLYMLPVCVGSFAFIITKSMSIVIRNDNAPRLVMVASLTVDLTNVVLDYVLMFPLDMGIFQALRWLRYALLLFLCSYWQRTSAKKIAFYGQPNSFGGLAVCAGL